MCVGFSTLSANKPMSKVKTPLPIVQKQCGCQGPHFTKQHKFMQIILFSIHAHTIPTPHNGMNCRKLLKMYT